MKTEVKEEEDIFEEEDDVFYRFEGKNIFYISDELRNNINKRLPRGFSLVKTSDLPQQTKFKGEIEYTSQKREIRVASEELAKQFVIPTQLPTVSRKQVRGGEEKILRCGQLPEGKSKQGQKIKGIIQRFRKHSRFTAFSQHLGRLGLASAMLQIQAQNRKNIHTIQSFKQRELYLFHQALNVTYEQDKVALINEMIDELQFLVQNAQKAEFANSLMLMQKSIDKVTREISEIRQTGSYFYRKKKRNQKNYDQKELLYIAELMKLLPKWQMVGVLEIIEEKPFSEIGNSVIEFDLHMLKNRKIREIQLYVKKKLCNFYKSRERKQMKIKAKRKAEQAAGKSNQEESQKEVELQPNVTENVHQKPKQQQFQEVEIKNQNEINYIFEVEDVDDEPRMEMEGSSMENMSSASNRNNDYSDNCSESQQEDLLLPESEISHRNRSISDHSEMVELGRDLENLDFEQPNLMVHIHNKREEGEEFQSSDSSYITDEEDSDF